MTVIMMASKKS